MTAQMVRANGVDLCVEGFGEPRDPAILLIMGAAASMLYWDAEFCARLAGAGRFVLRYDHRDTGRSSCSPPGAPDYGLRDLVDDAAGLLDAFDLSAAHVAGMSMGAAIGQLLALDHADRVETLTLMSGTPGGPGHEAPDLPPMSAALAAMFAEEQPEPDWSDRDAVVGYHVAGERAYTGGLPFDELGWRALAEQTFDRTVDSAAAFTNHFLLDPGAPWRRRLGEIRVPTLVLHGTDDPFVPLGHGIALAEEIPGARLVEVPGAGHEPPPRPRWDVVAPAIVQHTAS
ncbi:alpha/beta hydrolase [Pseudonocardia sp. NPDC049635]|uniref:alpha/beta fold hydrolase n=1 Tax=Pseudonocardia sp. NPDC049635 TaxID=3155506 RepID=UPI0033C40086